MEGGDVVIIREAYLSKLKELKDKNIIKIVTGIRRCGKSTLLFQFKDWLIDQGVTESQIILQIIGSFMRILKNVCTKVLRHMYS